MINIYYEFKKRYGTPRIAEQLNELGIPCCVNYVAQLLQYEGLRARNGKNFKYMPTACATSNVDGEWVHLTVILDLLSRQIIGWAIETMTTELIHDVFNMAVATRKITPGLILHSDRSVQYLSRYTTQT